MSALEQEIVKRLHQMTEDEQQKVLQFMESLGHPPKTGYKPSDLMKVPLPERERLISQAFELAADESFETFEAYSEEQIDDEP